MSINYCENASYTSEFGNLEIEMPCQRTLIVLLQSTRICTRDGMGQLPANLRSLRTQLCDQGVGRLCTALGEMLLWYESSPGLAVLGMVVWGSRKIWQMDPAFSSTIRTCSSKESPLNLNLKCTGQLDRHMFETLRVELMSKN
jgi:hypothetical protein